VTFTWAHTVLDGMAKSVVLSLISAKTRVVDLACGACGQGLGVVTEAANGPWLTVWVPDGNGQGSGDASNWSMAAGPLPMQTSFTVKCHDHGTASVDSELVRRQVDVSRIERACQKLPVQTGSA
jgi:hypothetical protein